MNSGLFRGLPGRSGARDAAEVVPETLQLDYVEFTAQVTVTATTEATATTVVTGNAVTFDGNTTVLIEFFSQDHGLGTAALILVLVLYEDGASIGIWSHLRVSVSGVLDSRMPVLRRRRIKPTSGSHTYSVRAYKSAAGTAFVAAGAGGAGTVVPGYIRIERVQP